MKRIKITLLLSFQIVLLYAQFDVTNLNLSIYRANNYSLAPSAAAPLTVVQFNALQDSITLFEDEWVYENMRIYPIVANEVYQEKSKEKN